MSYSIAEQPSTVKAAKLPALFAMLFGAFIILGTGFANSQTIHTVAHDSRHANVFPCH